MRHALPIMTLMLAFAGASSTQAQTVIHVPGDYPTIQAGINAASSGDTVLVAPGTYSGPGNRGLSFYGKAVTLRSEAGPAATAISGGGVDVCFRFLSNESYDTVVEGFTIREGWYLGGPGLGGGGILCSGASPTIRNCVIRQCYSNAIGGGMLATSGSVPFVDSCTFYNNGADSHGGGFYGTAILWNTDFTSNEAMGTGGVSADGGAAYVIGASEVRSCRFVDNHARRGGALYLGSDKVVDNCLFVSNHADVSGTSLNRGGAVYASSGSIYVEFSTFEDNDAIHEGHTIYSNQAQVTVKHSILWDSPSNGIVTAATGTVNATYSDIWQTSGVYPGTGNLNSDPLFVTGPGNPIHNHHYLSQTASGQATTSPCVDAGNYTASFWTYCDFGHGEDVCMDQATTRTRGMPDTALVDLGYHAYQDLLFGSGFDWNGTSAWSSVQP